MFEATIKPASTLKKALDAVTELVEDGYLDCNKSGVSLQAMDGSEVALVILRLRASAFNPYRCDQNFAHGINLDMFSKMLGYADNEDSVTIKGDSGTHVLTLTFDSKKGHRTSEFDLKIITIDAKLLDIPETAYDAIFSIPSTEFQRICSVLSNLGEYMVIDVTEDGVKFSASGDHGSGKIYLKNESSVDDDEEKATKVHIEKPVSLTFALEYMNDFTKATPLSSTVILCMGLDVPLLVEDKVSDAGYIRYYLAPKISDDE